MSGWLIALLVLGCALFAIAAIGVVAAVVIPNIGSLNDSARAAQARREAQAKNAAAPKLLPLTAQQQKALEQFGQDLAAAINDQDHAALVKMQDTDALIERVFDGLSGIPDREGMRRGFRDGLNASGEGWMTRLVDGKAAVLRTCERQGHPAVRLRLIGEEGGMSYVDVMVRPEGAGFKAVDIFAYVFATTVSADARNAVAAMLPQSGGKGLAALLGLPAMNKDALKFYEQLGEASREGQSETVLRLYEQLPAELKTQRPFFLTRLQALMELSSAGSADIDRQYKEALRAAPDILGKDSTPDLLMVDLLFMEEDYKGADECLKRAEVVIGGDAYLKVLRGKAHLQMNDHAGALALADEASKLEPDLTEAVDLRLSVHLDRGDFAGLVKEMRAFRQNSGVTLGREQLADDAAYADFLKSPEFAAWEKEIAQ